MKSISFSVNGEPVAKGRPRFAGGHIYTPQKTANYEHLIRSNYLLTDRVRFINDEELRLEINAYMSIPKNVSKKVRQQMLSGEKRPTKKPDYDNIAKICSDSLNGFAYKDDSQIVSSEINKYYSDTPRVEILIYEV